MKAKVFSLIILFIAFTSLTVLGQNNRQEPKFKKQKVYTKSYGVSSGDRINLDNQFGEMKLITWEKNEVKVDISISGSSDNEIRAQQILDRISIEDAKIAGSVSFKTKFANQDKDWNKNQKDKHINESMKINYTVYLPSVNPLNAKNQFGAMIVPDYRGEATLESQFGSLTTGRITNAKNIKVAFGKATLGQVSNGKVDISYSSATINKLSGDLDIKVQFSNNVKLNLDNDVKSLDLINSYSTVYLDMSKDFSASYDISNSYSSFSNKSTFTINKNSDKERAFNAESYSGKSGNGSTKVKIRSSFSTVTAGHDLKVDTFKKKKSATI